MQNNFENIIQEKEEEIKKLKKELEKSRSQLHIFYELTKAIRKSLRLDEMAYIILTGLTAKEGLGFNRAILFLTDDEYKNINGFMGIGFLDISEANIIWKTIETQKMDLYDLIENYHKIKDPPYKPKFMEFVESVSFPLTKESGFIFYALWEKGALHIKGEKIKELANDEFIKKFNLKEFLIASLWVDNKPQGIIVVDNYVTQKPISEENKIIFNMFIEYAASAIKNSKAYEDTLFMAHTDILTGLYNHGYFQYKLDEELLKAKSKNQKLSVIMMDVDNFKKFNDTYGHIQGDEALKKISNILNEGLDEKYILCRYGGEEFSLILPYTSIEESLEIGKNLLKKVENTEILNTRFTLSAGIATYPEHGLDKETLLKKADLALYKAKKEGKNKIVLAFNYGN